MNKEEVLQIVREELDSRNKVEIPVEVVDDGVVPVYAKKGDAGMDLVAREDIVLKPGESKAVTAGIKVAIPQGYEIQVRPRSGVSFKTKLRLSNSPGTIDSGFRDEVKVILENTNIKYAHHDHKYLNVKGDELTPDDVPAILRKTNPGTSGNYIIRKGTRIAQIVLAKYYEIDFKEVDDVSSIGFNRGGGLGSTGVESNE